MIKEYESFYDLMKKGQLDWKPFGYCSKCGFGSCKHLNQPVKKKKKKITK